jgi:hypothetical protein
MRPRLVDVLLDESDSVLGGGVLVAGRDLVEPVLELFGVPIGEALPSQVDELGQDGAGDLAGDWVAGEGKCGFHARFGRRREVTVFHVQSSLYSRDPP